MTERSSWKRREKVNILVRPCHFLTTICSYTNKKVWWIKDRRAVQNPKRIGKNAINKITKNPWWVWHFLPGDFHKMRLKSNATNERCLKVIIKALFSKDVVEVFPVMMVFPIYSQKMLPLWAWPILLLSSDVSRYFKKLNERIHEASQRYRRQFIPSCMKKVWNQGECRIVHQPVPFSFGKAVRVFLITFLI